MPMSSPQPVWLESIQRAYEQRAQLLARPENKRVEAGLMDQAVVLVCHRD